jgi:hypothetical protein
MADNNGSDSFYRGLRHPITHKSKFTNQLNHYSLSNYDLYMTQAKLVFIFINHKLTINHAIECIVLNWQDYTGWKPVG